MPSPPQGLPYVINMTLPDRSEDYIHRIGRVGRADTLGLAISLVSEVPEKVGRGACRPVWGNALVGSFEEEGLETNMGRYTRWLH